MNFSPRLVLLSGAAALLALPAVAQDITFGGDARAFSMGGAGVASLAGNGISGMGSRNNPASLAFAKGLMRFHFPNIGARANGAISLDKAANYLLTSGSGADATDLARRFASEDSSFGLNGSLGLRLGPVEVLASGVGQGYILPNASLQTWGKNGAIGGVPNDARADILATAVYSLPQIGIATKIAAGGENLSVAVGARLKYMNAVYAHYFGEKSTLDSGTDALKAPEMGGKDTLTKQGFGADLGIMVESKKLLGLSGGLVIANAIKPNFSFTGQFGTNASGGAGTRTYNLLATTATAGVGFQKGGMTAVADIVDITASVGKTELRAGVEQKLGPLAVRAGYNSANGYTYGLGIGGFDIALGKRQPLEIVRTLKF
jgi:F plasmid transfer operon, TraF, protein